MLLLRLFLLVMLIGYSKSGPTDDKKQKISNCDRMACFVPQICLNPGTSTELVNIPHFQEVIITCEAIVKIRSYTKQHLLIVLESYDSDVTKITLEQGTTKFECDANGNNVLAKFNDKNQKLESVNTSPLKCEFYAKTDDSQIFVSLQVKILTSKSAIPGSSFTMTGPVFFAFISATCDPESVKGREESSDDVKIVEKVDGKLGDLLCPNGAKLMYSENNAKFVETSSISCVKNENDVYGYVIPSSPKHLSNLKAQCETATCTLCDLEGLDTKIIQKYEENGCPKLKCITDHIKIHPAATPEKDPAECITTGSKHLWKLGDETTSKAKEITCGKMKCEQSIVEFMCQGKKEPGEQNCVVTPELLPYCLKGNLSLDGEIVEVQCSSKTSYHYQFKVKDKTFIYSNQLLSCVIPDNGKSTDADKSSKTSSASIESVALYVILALVVIAVIVGVAVWFVLKKKKGREAARPDFPAYPATAKEGQPKSKESKSVNSSKSNQGVESKKAEEKKEEEKKAEEKKAESKKEEEKPRGPTRQERMRLEGMNTQEIDEAIAKVEALQVSMPSIGGSTRKNEESVRRRSKNKKDKKKDETKQPDAKGDANKNTEDKMKGDKMKEEKEKEKEPSDVTKAGVSGGQTNMTVTGAETVAGK